MNNVQILELRRFVYKGQSNWISLVLITSLGTRLPLEIKLWFSIQNTRQFVDRSRQCKRCFRFNNPTSMCKSEQLCIVCSHERPCSFPVSCASCNGLHWADYNQCPSHLAEINFLQFKFSKFLYFTEA